MPLAAMVPMGGFALVAMFTFAYSKLGDSNVQKRPAEVCRGMGCRLRCFGGVCVPSQMLSAGASGKVHTTARDESRSSSAGV
jgi:hypothetical protein